MTIVDIELRTVREYWGLKGKVVLQYRKRFSISRGGGSWGAWINVPHDPDVPEDELRRSVEAMPPAQQEGGK